MAQQTGGEWQDRPSLRICAEGIALEKAAAASIRSSSRTLVGDLRTNEVPQLEHTTRDIVKGNLPGLGGSATPACESPLRSRAAPHTLTTVKHSPDPCNGLLPRQTVDSLSRSNDQSRETRGLLRSNRSRPKETKESIMKKLALAMGMVSIAVAASVAMADPGVYGVGMGMGMGPGCGAAAGANCPNAGGPGGYGPGHGCGGGYGPGAGQSPGGGYGHGGGQGMALLTPEEREQHREAMHSLTTVEQCNAYIAEHRQLLLERAKEKGVEPPPGPRGNVCERMKARGMFG